MLTPLGCTAFFLLGGDHNSLVEEGMSGFWIVKVERLQILRYSRLVHK